MTNPYASNKAILHMDRLLIIRAGEQPPPVHLHFIISDLCNQDCPWCAYRMENYTEHFAVIEADGTRNHNPNRMIQYEKTVEILEDFKALGGKAVQFTGGGEPTAHPRCGEIMAVAQGLGLETALVTNAVRLDKVFDSTLRSVWVRISVDASEPDTYMKTRRVPAGHWDKMLANVTELVRRRDLEGSPLTIGIGFVVHKDNWQEVADCARMAKGLGVDNLRISALFQPDDAAYFEAFHAEAAALCQEAESVNGGRFRVINNFGSRVADLEQQSPDYKLCGYQNFTTYIGADLNLYRCCVLSYTDRGTVGSLKDRRLIDLWNSPEKRQDFGKFDARSCPRCQFNDKNRDINRIIGELPVTHGNFV